MFGAADEDGFQRVGEVGLVGEPRRRDRIDGHEQPVGTDGQARAAQGLSEPGEVAGKLGVVGEGEGDLLHQPYARTASTIADAAAAGVKMRDVHVYRAREA